MEPLTKDFTLRLSLATRKLNEQRQQRLAEIGFESRKKGNVGHYLNAFIAYELKRLQLTQNGDSLTGERNNVRSVVFARV